MQTTSNIEGAINIPVADLREEHKELNRKDTIILICDSGNRSSLGVSILVKFLMVQGFIQKLNK